MIAHPPNQRKAGWHDQSAAQFMYPLGCSLCRKVHVNTGIEEVGCGPHIEKVKVSAKMQAIYEAHNPLYNNVQKPKAMNEAEAMKEAMEAARGDPEELERLARLAHMLEQEAFR